MIKSLIRDLAFHPPHPTTYELQADHTAEYGSRIIPAEPILRELYPIYDKMSKEVDAFLVTKPDGAQIVAFRARSPSLPRPGKGEPNPDNRVTVIYSHPNAVDLGFVLPYGHDFAKSYFCDFIAYDYTGYGLNFEPPSVEAMLSDLETVLIHSRHIGVDLSRVVLFGESIGSIPTVNLATKYDVRGVILQGALASGVKLFFPSLNINPFGLDCFRNIDHVPNIRCPVLFVHSEDDEICPFKAVKEMYKKCPAAAGVEPLWIKEGGHGGCSFDSNYMKRVQTFLFTLQ